MLLERGRESLVVARPVCPHHRSVDVLKCRHAVVSTCGSAQNLALLQHCEIYQPPLILFQKKPLNIFSVPLCPRHVHSLPAHSLTTAVPDIPLSFAATDNTHCFIFSPCARRSSKTGLKAIDFGLPLLVPMKLRKRALIGVPGQAGGAMRKTILASPADPPLSVRRRRNSATKIKHRRSRPSPHVTNSARFTFQSALVAAATEQKPFASLHVPTASTFTTDEGVGAEPSPSSEEERDTCSGEVRENSPPKIIWTPASLKKPHHGLRLDLPSHRFDVSADAENLCPSDQESGDTEAYSPTPSPTPSPGNIDRLRRPFAQAAPDAVAFWESREAESASPVQFKRMSMPMKRVARQRTTAAVGAARWNSWSALPENFAVGGQLKTSE